MSLGRCKIQVMALEAMQEMAGLIGNHLEKGDVLALIGDLGTGKTTLSKGIGAALGIEGHMASPSYTIVNAYASRLGPLYHADVYRIDDADALEDIGFFDYLREGGLVIVEWADKIREALMDEASRYLEISIHPALDGRELVFFGPLEWIDAILSAIKGVVGIHIIESLVEVGL